MRKIKRKIWCICCSIVLLINGFSLCKLEIKTEHSVGTTYYVDSDKGNDSNVGTRPNAAWATLEKVNSTEFQPGDKILFQKGDVWTGQLSPKGSGTKENPIIIGDYGNAESRPLIHGGRLI